MQASLRLHLLVSVSWAAAPCASAPKLPAAAELTGRQIRVHSGCPRPISERAHVHRFRGGGLEHLPGNMAQPTPHAHRKGGGLRTRLPSADLLGRGRESSSARWGLGPLRVQPGLSASRSRQACPSVPVRTRRLVCAHLGLLLVWGGDRGLPERWQMSAGTRHLARGAPGHRANGRGLAGVPQDLSESLCRSCPCRPHGLGEQQLLLSLTWTGAQGRTVAP